MTLGIPAAVFVMVGAFLTRILDNKILEFLLAVFLIVASSIFLVFKNLTLKPTLAHAISGGIFSGLIAGLIGTGGAIRGLVLAAFGLQMEVFIATSAIIDLAIDLSRSVVYSLNGYVHKDDLYLIPFLFLVNVAGTFFGKKILSSFSQERFRRIVLILIFGMGISILIKNII